MRRHAAGFPLFSTSFVFRRNSLHPDCAGLRIAASIARLAPDLLLISRGKIMSPARASVVACVLLIAACAAGPKPDSGTARPPSQIEAPAAPKPTAPPAALDPPAAGIDGETATPAEKPLSREPASVSASPAEVRPSSPKPAIVAAPVVAPAVKAKPAKPAVPAVPATRPPAPVAVAKPSSDSSEANVAAGRIEGRIELVAGSGQSLDADEMSRAVVYYVSDSTKTRIKPGRYQIYTHNKQFEPESLVIPLGSTISFPNQDEILHNVFSVTPQSAFDLGIYGEGATAEYTFKKTGLVLINCNVHQAMQANVLVVDTPYVASPGTDGHFELANLPSGTGKLMVWHPRATIQSQPVTIPQSGEVSLRLTLTKPRISEHLNKERKPY